MHDRDFLYAPRGYKNTHDMSEDIIKIINDTVSVDEVRKAVKEQEPDVEMISADKMKEIENKKESKTGAQIARLVIGILIAGIGLYAKLPNTISTIFIILGYAILLFRTAKNAFKMLFASKKINENFFKKFALFRRTFSFSGKYIL